MIELIQIDLPNLQRIADSAPANFGALVPLEGALPPSRVAKRSLALLNGGAAALWCIPFLIVPRSRDSILGGCGFKAPPVHGSVEIGYGVAESQRGRGIATAAVECLLKLATSSNSVQKVFALIIPENLASQKVVRRLGFSMQQSLVDADGDRVVQWTYHIGPPL